MTLSDSEKDSPSSPTGGDEERGPTTLMAAVARPFSAKSHKSFKQLVRVLAPALKAHLGVVRRDEKVKIRFLVSAE